MDAFELTYLGRTRFHDGNDAVALYFRVLRNGRYIGAYAGAIAGPDLTTFGPKPGKKFWAALAQASANAIGVRLLSNARPSAKPHEVETVWVKAVDVRSHLDDELGLPVEDQVFRRFRLDQAPVDPPAQNRILSTGSSSISLKAAAARSKGADDAASQPEATV